GRAVPPGLPGRRGGAGARDRSSGRRLPCASIRWIVGFPSSQADFRRRDLEEVESHPMPCTRLSRAALFILGCAVFALGCQPAGPARTAGAVATAPTPPPAADVAPVHHGEGLAPRPAPTPPPAATAA